VRLPIQRGIKSRLVLRTAAADDLRQPGGAAAAVHRHLHIDRLARAFRKGQRIICQRLPGQGHAESMQKMPAQKQAEQASPCRRIHGYMQVRLLHSDFSSVYFLRMHLAIPLSFERTWNTFRRFQPCAVSAASGHIPESSRTSIVRTSDPLPRSRISSDGSCCTCIGIMMWLFSS